MTISRKGSLPFSRSVRRNTDDATEERLGDAKKAQKRMNLDFSEHQYALRDQLRRFLGDRCPPTAVRAVVEGERAHDAPLYRGLAELGVLGAAIPEAYGGVGLGQLEWCVLAEELGRVLAPVPVGSSIFLAANILLEAGSESQKRALLPGIAAGERIATLAHLDAPDDDTICGSRRLTGTKTLVPDGLVADGAIVRARDRDHHDLPSLYWVDLASPRVSRRPVDVIDLTHGSAIVTFDDAECEPIGDPGQAQPILDHVFDQAAILFAFEQVGGAERVLEQARDFALDRMAFGRPIGSFQALKHMMANMYVAATLARSNAYYGAWALSADHPELPVAAATARLSASQAYLECARNAIQVHGGIGFTWESDCHLHYRRASALSLALGAQRFWKDQLIERMVARAQRKGSMS